MSLFRSKIEVSGGVVRGAVYSNPNARMSNGEGFHELGWREAEAIAEELKAMATKMRAIEAALGK